MRFPLSKEELHFIDCIREKFNGKSQIALEEREVQEWQDILAIMSERGTIRIVKTISETDCLLTGDIEIFQSWISNENKKVKRITRREWNIAIVSAIISATLTVILSNASQILRWFRR